MNLLADIADVADQLTDPPPHLEKIYTTPTTRHRRLTHLHKTTQPGLLTQLRDAVLPAATQDANNQRGIPRSQPPLQRRVQHPRPRRRRRHPRLRHPSRTA